MRALLCGLAAILLTQPVARAAAQGEEKPPASRASLGLSVSRYFASDAKGLFAINFHSTGLHRIGATYDVTVALPPRVLAEGVLVVAPEVNLAWHIPLAKAALLPKAGVALVVGLGESGGGVLPGVQWGAGLILPGSGTLELRVDVVQHRYAMDLGAPIYSAGLGVVRRWRPGALVDSSEGA